MRISDWSSDVCSSDLVEEGFCHYQCRPLVPIHKRLVARNSEGVACGRRGRIGIVIRRQVAWPRERRLQQADVANARATTMFGQLLFVEDERFELINPNPVMCNG